MKRLLCLFLTLGIFIHPLQAKTPLNQVANYAVGKIYLPQGSVSHLDFMVSVFSDDLGPLQYEPQIAFPPVSQESPVHGCLSVAHLQLHSGVQYLMQPGTLTLACPEAPKGSEVYGWIEGSWQKVRSHRTPSGEFKAEFHHLTTYGLFKSSPQKEAPSPLSRI